MKSRVSRREFIGHLPRLPAGILALSAADTVIGRMGGQRPPDIFYICVDDMGTYLNCYGNSEVLSPGFDAFARDSVLFERAYCQIAVCTASRTSILTGTRPEATGLLGLRRDWKRHLPGVTSLPEHLTRHGYESVSVGKIWDPRAGSGTRLGWRERHDPWGISNNRLAVKAIAKYRQRRKPTAYFIGYSSPHCPWNAADRYTALYADAAVTVNGPGRRLHGAYARRCTGQDTMELTDAQAVDLTRRYYAEVTEVDALIGDLLNRIDEWGMYDDSIIVLWSGDHGYHLGQNGRWGKWTNHTAATRVPLLIRVPGMSRGEGKRCPRVVECVDMYRTLGELAGIELPGHTLAGRSLVPLLQDPVRPWDTRAYSLWGKQGIEQAILSVKDERWNYIEYPTGERLLFDTVADLSESHNLIEQAPQQAALMGEWLREHFFAEHIRQGRRAPNKGSG